jgi:hypothetical protein
MRGAGRSGGGGGRGTRPLGCVCCIIRAVSSSCEATGDDRIEGRGTCGAVRSKQARGGKQREVASCTGCMAKLGVLGGGGFTKSPCCSAGASASKRFQTRRCFTRILAANNQKGGLFIKRRQAVCVRSRQEAGAIMRAVNFKQPSSGTI